MEDKIIDYLSQTPENTNPAVLHTLLGDLNKQPDWNQNDSTAADYIKNRPFYEEITEVVMLPETSFECVTVPSEIAISNSFPYTFEVGQDYAVTWDGETNIYTAIEFDVVGALTNTSLDDAASGSGWVIVADDGVVGLQTLDSSLLGTHTISISKAKTETHMVDRKYLTVVQPLIIYAKAIS